VIEPATGAARDDRRSFLRCRRRALAGSTGTVGALAVLAAVFLAPNRLASLRLGDVSLAWWVAGTVALAGLVTVIWGFRDTGPTSITAGTSRFTPLALAAVWSSPALWLGLPPLLLADGTRGLWVAIVVVVGAVLALLLLGTPWNRTGRLTDSASTLARTRWPAAWGCHAFLGSIETAVAGLFVWAQLTAARDVGAMVGWPRAVTIVVAGFLVTALFLPDLARIRLTATGGGLALAGLAVPLVVIAVGTTTARPLVWSAVASRARIAFGEGSRWTTEGGTVRGPASTLTLRFADEQRVAFAGRGSVVVEPREGGRLARDVEAGQDVALHPGDRLVVPGGLRLRFEAGRRVPNAPDSGPEWMEPSSRPMGLLWLVAFAVTGCLGALGLPAGDALVGTGRQAPGRSAALAVTVVTSGVALAVGWSLYAAWLTPEIYVGGITGAEVYTLSSTLSGSPASAVLLTWLVLGGLGVGGAASALAGIRGLPTGGRNASVTGTSRVAVALVASAGALACLVPLGPGTVLVLALGLAASALGPAVALACWSERATPQGTAGGAAVGVAVFLLLVTAGVVTGGGLSEGWGSIEVAAPAALAAGIHLLAAWLLRSRGIASPRSPLPPGLDRLSIPLPARPRAG
jgi:hypothetical protein